MKKIIIIFLSVIVIVGCDKKSDLDKNSQLVIQCTKKQPDAVILAIPYIPLYSDDEYFYEMSTDIDNNVIYNNVNYDFISALENKIVTVDELIEHCSPNVWKRPKEKIN